MVNRNEGLRYDVGQGFSELDAEAARGRLDGHAVISGLKVTTDGTDLTLDVGQSAGGGTATVGKTSGSVDTASLASAGTVTLDAADSTNPRKDTVYIDTSSNLQVEKGIAEAADPSGNTRFNTFEPEPPYPSTEGTILAEVWVAAGASSIASADIRDRRQPSELVGDSARLRELGNAPIVFSSGYDTIQAALDAAGSGHLLIDDTKTEEGIGIGTQHDGATIEWVGDNWIEQPASPTAGEAVIRMEDASGVSPNEDVSLTLIRPRIRNPNLADADILNEDTITSADRTSAIETNPPSIAFNYNLRNWRIIDPVIHHVNGYGIAINGAADSLVVRGGEIEHTAFDGVRETPQNTGVNVTIDGVTCRDNGRHNFSTSGSADEHRVSISGLGERAYTTGVNVEPGANVTLDCDIREPSTSNGSKNVDSGLLVNSGSSMVRGSVRVYDANHRAATISGPVDGLTVECYRAAGEENPQGTIEVKVNSSAGDGGDMTVIARGGGGSSSPFAVFADGIESWDLDVNVRESYGAPVKFNAVKKSNISIKSKNPVRGGTDVHVDRRAHAILESSSNGNTLDNLISLVATDENSNVEDGIVSADGGTDHNRIMGNIRNAYTTNATENLGTNEDTTDLTT